MWIKWISRYRLIKNDLGMIWLARKHADCPAWLNPVLALLLIYLVLAPEGLLIFGIISDFVLLPWAISTIVKMLPKHIVVAQA